MPTKVPRRLSRPREDRPQPPREVRTPGMTFARFARNGAKTVGRVGPRVLTMVALGLAAVTVTVGEYRIATQFVKPKIVEAYGAARETAAINWLFGPTASRALLTDSILREGRASRFPGDVMVPIMTGISGSISFLQGTRGHGMYGLTDAAWKRLVDSYGPENGITPTPNFRDLLDDPYVETRLVAARLGDEFDRFSAESGRMPSPSDYVMVHAFGGEVAARARAILEVDPSAPLGERLGITTWARWQTDLLFKGNEWRSAADVYAFLGALMERYSLPSEPLAVSEDQQPAPRS